MASTTATQMEIESSDPAPPGLEAFPPESDLDRLFELVVRLSANLDVETLHEDLLCTIASLQGTGMGLLMLLDEDLEDLVPVFCIGAPDEYCVRVGRVALGEGPYGRAAGEKRMVFVEDVEDDSVDAAYRDLAQLAGFRSSCTVPMLTRAGAVLGTLTTYFPVPRRPALREAHLVEVFALQAAQFLTNARTHRAIRLAAEGQYEARSRAVLLADLSGALLESLDRPLVGLAEVVRIPTRWFADYCVVDLLGDDGAVVLSEGARRGAAADEVLRQLVGQPISAARREAITQVVRTRSPLHLREVDPVLVGVALVDPTASSPRSAIVLPLVGEDRVFGVMTMVRSRVSAGGFGEDDLVLASEIASRVGLAFEHSRALQARPAPPSSGVLPVVICQDLRSQLDLIDGSVSTLGDDRLAGEARARHAATASRYARQASELLHELEGTLLEQQGGASVPALMDAGSLLQEALELAAGGVSELPLVRLESLEDLPFVHTDRARAVRALRHLAKFLRTVGPAFEEVRVWVTAEGEGICFWFAGAAPAPAKKPRSRGADEAASWADRRAYHGFVVAKDIIDALGGEIRVEGGPDGEARFSVRLPAVSR